MITTIQSSVKKRKVIYTTVLHLACKEEGKRQMNPCVGYTMHPWKARGDILPEHTGNDSHGPGR